VRPSDLPAWAEEQAAALLSDLGDRWKHVQAVARCAERVSVILAPEDRPYLVAAAWLHDVGYAPDLAVTNFHALDGARFVRTLGHERLAGLVAYHSGAQHEVELRGLADELAEFYDEASDVSAVLTYCDMRTGSTGEPVTLDERQADVVQRCGTGHVVSRSITRAKPQLARDIERTEAKVRASEREP